MQHLAAAAKKSLTSSRVPSTKRSKPTSPSFLFTKKLGKSNPRPLWTTPRSTLEGGSRKHKAEEGFAVKTARRVQDVIFPHFGISTASTHLEPIAPDRVLHNVPGTPGVPFLLTREDTRAAPASPTRATSAMHSYVEVVTAPTADTPDTAILLHYDDRRYIFGGISEGTQRALSQRGTGLGAVEDIFISGPISWSKAGGLLGMILTLADMMAHKMVDTSGKVKVKRDRDDSEWTARALPALRIHGGKNLAHTLAASRRFVFRKGLPLEPYEIRDDPRQRQKPASSQPDWQDGNVNIWYMPLQSSDVAVPTLSPRKRSHGAMTGPEYSVSREENDQKLVDNVVMAMFSSKWSMDALVETRLREVKLPAKLFVRDEQGHLQEYDGPVPEKGGQEDVPDIKVLVRKPWPASQIKDLPRTQPSGQSLCYIVKSHSRRGKFLVEKAKKFNLNKKDWGELSRGVTVTDLDGKTVMPQDVLAPDIPGIGFAVLDVPDMTYFAALMERPEWSDPEIFSSGIKDLFWLFGPGVASDPVVKDFLAKKKHLFNHIVSSPDVAPNMVALESSAAQTYKLHSIDPRRFPLPAFNNKQSLTGESPEASELYKACRSGQRIMYAPRHLHEDDKVVPFPNIEKMALSTVSCDSKELLEMARQANLRATDPVFLSRIEEVESDIPGRDAEIITLGTGSALPSKYRNVSATLVRVPGAGNYLFDAGEGTLGQMRRVFGKELPAVLRDLRVIWISHLHADHHLGTTSVIKAWHEETLRSKPDARLHVASHDHMAEWLREYSDVEDFGYRRLTMSRFGLPNMNTSKVPSSDALADMGLSRMDVCYVDHCFGSMATAFTWPSGLKIAYSGDCRPSDNFAKIGRGATLLIHESTFDDELQGDAVAKKHSTMSEAIDVGRRMGARRVLLTHFSQRYQKFPPVEDDVFELVRKAEGATGQNRARVDEVILVAFDMMCIKLGDFRKAQAFLPPLRKVFEGDTSMAER